MAAFRLDIGITLDLPIRFVMSFLATRSCCSKNQDNSLAQGPAMIMNRFERLAEMRQNSLVSCRWGVPQVRLIAASERTLSKREVYQLGGFVICVPSVSVKIGGS